MTAPPLYEVRFPGRLVQQLDCTSWGQEGLPLGTAARRKLEQAEHHRVGGGSQVRPRFTYAELGDVADHYEGAAGTAAVLEGYNDLDELRSMQAEASLLAKAAERACAAWDAASPHPGSLAERVEEAAEALDLLATPGPKVGRPSFRKRSLATLAKEVDRLMGDDGMAEAIAAEGLR